LPCKHFPSGNTPEFKVNNVREEKAKEFVATGSEIYYGNVPVGAKGNYQLGFYKLSEQK
jgi:hypothetical protein